jgi:endo-1,4-beta-xylanase
MGTQLRSRRDFLNQTIRATLATAIATRVAGAQDSNQGKFLSALPLPADLTGSRSLRVHAGARGLLVGCAVAMKILPDTPLAEREVVSTESDLYGQAVASQANILVAENAMKWDALRPTADSFDFTEADRLFDFAARAGQKLRGHNLCWHQAIPGWLPQIATKANAADLLVHHIEAVAGRYAGSVHSWDVVNEAIRIEDGRPDALRKSIWLDLIGPDYIDLAFKTAARVDPHARLTYNDYGIELDTPDQMTKRGQVLLLIRRMKARGIPIHAVGIQSHLDASNQLPGDGVIEFVRELRKMGLEVYITELDVRSGKLAGGEDARMKAVAHVYSDYLERMLVEPNVAAVLTWGISNRYSWLNRQDPNSTTPKKREFGLPFDEDFHPTPVFFAMRDAVDDSARKLGGVTPGAAPADPYAPFSVPGSSPKQ